jgi:Ca-activated chloride channel family protein
MKTRGGRNKSCGLAGLGLLALLTTGGIDRKAAQLNNQGNGLYDAKKYDEAAQLYDDAASRDPEAAAIYYNQGNALFRQGKLEEAAKLLQRGAQSPDASTRQRSLYNLGNALYGTKKLPEAVAAYRQALVLDPRDRDAKINFEKALRELQQQQQQQQQQGQQGKQGDQKKDSQGQNQQQEQQGEQSKDQQSKEQQSKEQQGQPQSQDQQPPPPQPARLDSVPAGELSKEEALRILEAMRQQEKELQAEKARHRVRTRRVDKDW